MIGILIWLFGVIVSCLILFLIIRSAIDGSVLSGIYTELRTMNSSVKREQQEMKQQIEQLSALVREQNAIITSMQPREGAE